MSSGYLSKLERGVYRAPSREVLTRIAGALAVPVSDLYRAAGLEHLMVQDDPALRPLLEVFAPKLNDLPRRDRELILAELHRIFEAEGGATS